MKKIVLLPVRLLLIIQCIQGLHLPILVPRGATWPRLVLNWNSPEVSLLSIVSSTSIPFSRVQLLIYVNIPLYPSKTHGSRKCIKSRVWPDPFASSIYNVVMWNKVLNCASHTQDPLNKKLVAKPNPWQFVRCIDTGRRTNKERTTIILPNAKEADLQSLLDNILRPPLLSIIPLQVQ